MLQTPCSTRATRPVAPSLFAGLAIALTASLTSADFGDQLYQLVPEAEAEILDGTFAIRGNTAIVHAPGDGAYLFDLATGERIALLESNALGGRVGISGTTAILGSSTTESAYLIDTTTGEQIAELRADDGSAGDFFGQAVAICGTTVVVGAQYDGDNGTGSGSAYVFDAAIGEQVVKLLAEDGFNQDNFGRHVATSASRAIIGAPQNGSAYLFDTATGRQIAKLVPDGEEADGFGTSVAISGSIVLVGSPFDGHDGFRSGAVYVFDATTSEQIAKLRPENAFEFGGSDQFGASVAVFGATAIIGAPRDDDAAIDAGAVYLFDVATGAQITKLLADNGTRDDHFGRRVAIGETLALISAAVYPIGQAIYVFDVDRSLCRADFDASGTVGFEDILRVLRAWGDHDAPEDLDGCGTVDAVDLRIVLDAWGACD